MYQALYRKWRPKTFADVVGQEHITATLQKQVADGRLSHAYLFTGTRGTGKTTCAKILAKAVNCEHPENGNPCNRCQSCLGIDSGTMLDVLELDAASNNGVDHVRTLREDAIYSPAQVKRRVYIVDEVHMLSISAFNALLKILEEPPEHLMFILATTELHKVPATILSRCQRFSFRRIRPQDITARLAYVASQEDIDLTADGAELLSRLADGALRDALSLLDQCAAAGGRVNSAAVLETLGMAGNLQTAALMEHILCRDTKSALLLLQKLYSDGKDVGTVLGELSALARDLLIGKTAPEGGAALLSGSYDAATLSSLAELADSTRLIAMLTLLQKSCTELYLSADRKTDTELCLLRLCDDSLCGDLTALNARIARLEQQLAAGAAPRAAETASNAATVIPSEEQPQPIVIPFEEEMPPPPPEEDAYPPTAPPSAETNVSEPPAPMPKSEVPWDEMPRNEVPQSSVPQPQGSDLWSELMDSYKSRLMPDKRAFITMAHGELSDDTLVVTCPNDLQKSMLDVPAVTEVLSSVTGGAVGRAVSVRFTVGDGKPVERDKFQELLQKSRQFDNFTVK